MSTFNIQIREHYNFKAELLIFLENNVVCYRVQVINPPASFWDNRKQYQSSTFDGVMDLIVRALEDSVRQQLET